MNVKQLVREIVFVKYFFIYSSLSVSICNKKEIKY